LAQAASFLICIRKVPGLNLEREIHYPGWGFSRFPLSLQTNAKEVSQIRPLPISSTFFSISFQGQFNHPADNMIRLSPLEHWDHRFDSHSKHGCLCAFILCVRSGLALGVAAVQGVLPTV
jgi:hypothetical protein